MLVLLLPSPGAPRFSAALICKLPDNEFRKTFYRGVRASEGGAGARGRERGETEHALLYTTLRVHRRGRGGKKDGSGERRQTTSRY